MRLDLVGFEKELRGRVGEVAGAVLLFEHFELLRRWNERLNLTAIRDELEMVERHYCESIFLARHVPRETRTVLDIGSGAGFPGIPLAVARPELKVGLVESHKRKAVFLKEATRNLSNVEVLCARAEDIHRNADMIVSRAVDPGEVVGFLPKLSSRAFLLTGDVTILGSERIPLPWGDRRYLITVSR